jgi:hypothetical protein
MSYLKLEQTYFHSGLIKVIISIISFPLISPRVILIPFLRDIFTPLTIKAGGASLFSAGSAGKTDMGINEDSDRRLDRLEEGTEREFFFIQYLIPL